MGDEEAAAVLVRVLESRSFPLRRRRRRSRRRSRRPSFLVALLSHLLLQLLLLLLQVFQDLLVLCRCSSRMEEEAGQARGKRSLWTRIAHSLCLGVAIASLAGRRERGSFLDCTLGVLLLPWKPLPSAGVTRLAICSQLASRERAREE